MQNAKTPPTISSAQLQLINLYGFFMVAWSALESVIQAAIMKELDISPTKAVIITGKLQFQPRIQLLINLLKQNTPQNQEAIKAMQKMEGFAHRNTIVHGLIVIGKPEQLTFIKYDGGASVSQSFTPIEMERHVNGLNDRSERIQHLLGITDREIQEIGDATLSLVKVIKKST
ncbi:hypothetical protein [Pseudomonas syringae]|uniref:Uncharacterized protein n=1 Tax=Pseudomonas syringae pv. syringae TaxID=321 RepID=A0AAE5VVU9_PSESY|nr:hypothetical protein [Pseudomonas syringae]POQ05552.1 hypothetical protein CXB42_05275 [Pseudomonas syringae pv. syringae]